MLGVGIDSAPQAKPPGLWPIADGIFGMLKPSWAVAWKEPLPATSSSGATLCVSKGINERCSGS